LHAVPQLQSNDLFRSHFDPGRSPPFDAATHDGSGALGGELRVPVYPGLDL
jgi:hypothetical protein